MTFDTKTLHLSIHVPTHYTYTFKPTDNTYGTHVGQCLALVSPHAYNKHEHRSLDRNLRLELALSSPIVLVGTPSSGTRITLTQTQLHERLVRSEHLRT